jgi:hypothetical protein
LECDFLRGIDLAQHDYCEGMPAVVKGSAGGPVDGRLRATARCASKGQSFYALLRHIFTDTLDC